MAETSSETIVRLPVPPPIHPENLLGPTQWGVVAFLVSEVAFFGTLIAAYVSFIGAHQSGATPSVLSLPLVIGTTACLLSSSLTVHLAERALRQGRMSAFVPWWSATIVLGALFLAGTGYEWHDLIVHEGLTISTNIFGSTFYTLVGFHSLHVTAGVVLLLIMLALVLRGQVTHHHPVAVEMTSWYWHFVDAVWVVVFTVVYLVGR
jgi:cytochrome c oxidase subunit III